MGYVLGTIKPPSASIKKEGQQVSNPDYEFWDCRDQLILAAIIASVTFYVMNIIVDAKTSAEAWTKLQVAFANKLATRILSSREKLSRTKRDSRPVAEYLQTVKSIAEELSLCGSPITDVDLVVHVLGGVGSEFCDIAAVIHARDTVITFDELQDKLLAHELYLKQIDPSFDSTPIIANYTRKGNNIKHSFQQKQGSDQQWLLETGASHHITNDLRNLSLHSPYDGSDELHLTDGDLVQRGDLRVSHISSKDKLADFLTKPLSKQQFQLNRSKIGLQNGSLILRGSVKDIPVLDSSLGKRSDKR
ncbi:hypothetical protein GH714_014163 [Hevea brasiliensis]|uniref:Uncharacterized protein n=1 Tax=Hevea brasiliensis TaxID=3981 RepID=A0A6A6LKF1_HEVBR|nr:hypothetical protein GH714_014163 [Hevea brasiliensis]